MNFNNNNTNTTTNNDDDIYTQIECLIPSNLYENVQQLVQLNPYVINQIFPSGTLLHLTVQYENIYFIMYLLEMGNNANARNRCGETVMTYIIENCKKKKKNIKRNI